MNKLWTIIKREYLIRVKSKGFVIGTVLGPIIMSSFVLIPVLVGRYSGPDKYNIVVLDQTGDTTLYERMNVLLIPKRSGQPRYELTREALNPGEDVDTRRQVLTGRLAKKEIDGILILPADVLSQKEITIYSKNAAAVVGRTRVEDALNKAISERRIALAGLDAERVRELTKDVTLKAVNSESERSRERSARRSGFCHAHGSLPDDFGLRRNGHARRDRRKTEPHHRSPALICQPLLSDDGQSHWHRIGRPDSISDLVYIRRHSHRLIRRSGAGNVRRSNPEDFSLAVCLFHYLFPAGLFPLRHAVRDGRRDCLE